MCKDYPSKKKLNRDKICPFFMCPTILKCDDTFSVAGTYTYG